MRPSEHMPDSSDPTKARLAQSGQNVTLKEKELDEDFGTIVKKNPVLWTLGLLLTGFLGGIATYEGVQKMTGQQSVSSSEYHGLQKTASDLKLALDKKTSELADVTNLKNQPAPTVTPAKAKALVRTGAPVLHGTIIGLWFPNSFGPQAAEMKKILEGLGATVDLTPTDKSYPRAPNTVYYYRNNLTDKAETVREALKQFGFTHTNYYSKDPNPHFDIGIWLS